MKLRFMILKENLKEKIKNLGKKQIIAISMIVVSIVGVLVGTITANETEYKIKLSSARNVDGNNGVFYLYSDGTAYDTMWEYTSMFETDRDYDYYCLRGGLPAVDSSETMVATYNAKNSDILNTLTSEEKTALFKNYDSFLWLSKNIYIVSDNYTDVQKQYMKDCLENLIKAYSDNPEIAKLEIENYDTLLNGIHEELISVLQQVAIWQVTNNAKEDYGRIITCYSDVKTNLKVNSTSMTDIQAKSLYALYIALTEGAKDAGTGNARYSVLEASEANYSISLNSSAAKVNLTDVKTGIYKMGPFKVTTANDGLLESVTDSLDINCTYKKYLYNGGRYDEMPGINVEYYMEIIPATEISEETNINYSVQGKCKNSLLNVTANVYSRGGILNTTKQPLLEIYKTIGNYSVKDTEQLTLKPALFDVALTKQIVKVVRDGVTEYESEERLKSINTSGLLNGNTTATYIMDKTVFEVEPDDEVTYKIAVYNEGNLEGYVRQITDYIPEGLKLKEVSSTSNKGAIVTYEEENNVVKISLNASKEFKGQLLSPFVGESLDADYVLVTCTVDKDIENEKVLRNVAEITDYGYKIDNTYISATVGDAGTIDRDSKANSLTKEQIDEYPSVENSNVVKSTYNIEDDDDFEIVKTYIPQLDFALRKFITQVEVPSENLVKKYNREPMVNPTVLTTGGTTAKYLHTKKTLEVSQYDLVTYTIRIYNEGEMSGYASKIVDEIPEGLEFYSGIVNGQNYNWEMYKQTAEDEYDFEYNGKKYIRTDISAEADIITTDYLSYEAAGEDNLIQAFRRRTTLDYKDVQVTFKVVEENSSKRVLTNVAEIAEEADRYNNKVIDKQNNTVPYDVVDRDSVPANAGYQANDILANEDDIDIEPVKLKNFDLALRKFITKINDEEITNRVPVFSIDENGNYVYNHTKETLEVTNGDVVVYTLRVYNEGNCDGYAMEIKDDIPQGLEFLTENELNTYYRWKMLDVNGNITQDVNNAKYVVTDYLSKTLENKKNENLLEAFDAAKEDEPDYKEVRVAFRVNEPETSDRIIINHAQISEDTDAEGYPVKDIDSTPNEWIEGEDDQDVESIRVRYFDLALVKWVSKAIVIENGVETIQETGHTGEENPEPIVKVDLNKSKINDVVVKFEYKIKVTNEGEISGYVKEITDYIPAGLRFNAVDNPDWVDIGDGKMTTDLLKDTLLEPGESAEVTIILTWINGIDNLGLKVNYAEISEDSSTGIIDTPDIDSTPDNFDGTLLEDDDDDAPIMITVKTGQMEIKSYLILGIISLTIISVGIILIKKFVIK